MSKTRESYKQALRQLLEDSLGSAHSDAFKEKIVEKILQHLPAVIHLVTIQDKSLYGEPDVALGVVEADDEVAARRAADDTIIQLAESGRGRCVPHARAVDLGNFYRLGALVRLPPSDGDAPTQQFVEYLRNPTQMMTVATSWPAETYGSISLFGDDEEAPFRGWAEPSQIPGRPSVCLRANGESSWMSPDDARKLAAMLIAAANGVNAFDPSKT